MSIIKKVSRVVEYGLGWVVAGLFLVWSLAYLLAHDIWQKVKDVWNNYDATSSYPLSGALGGATIGGFLAGFVGAAIGAVGGWFVGAAASLKKQANAMAAANRAPVPTKNRPVTVDEDVNIPVRFDDVPVKTKTKKEKVKKQSKNSKTSDTIVPPAPTKKKPGRPRKKSVKKEVK